MTTVKRKRTRAVAPEQIQRMKRRRAAGQSIRDIADDLGISRQWVGQLLRRPNPGQEPLTWACGLCSGSFTSTTRDGPERCPLCRRYGWRSQPGDG